MINILVTKHYEHFFKTVEEMVEAKKDINRIGTLNHNHDAIDYINTHNPDLIFMDANVLTDAVLSTIYKLKTKHPNVKIVMITDDSEQENLFRPLLSGLDGILLEDLSADLLYSSICNIVKGQTVVSSDISKVLIQHIIQITGNGRWALAKKLRQKGIRLTNRELDVANLFRLNYNNVEIAHELSLSEGTVKNYVSNIYNVLGINHRNEAINYLQRILTNIYS